MFIRQTERLSWPLPALIHWEVELGGTSMKEVITMSARGESSKGRRRIWAFVRRSGRAVQPRYSWPLPALIHWEVKVGGKSMEDVGGAGFAGSSLPFLGRERAAVDVDPERRSPRYHYGIPS